MARIAIISDIHGNLPALEAVYADLVSARADQVIVNGDLVGRGPHSAEVLDFVAGQKWTIVQGNHEAFWTMCARGMPPDDWEDGWWAPTRLEMQRLPRAWFDWMAALPFQHIVEVPGAPKIQVVHGSPNRLSEGLYAHERDHKLDAILAKTPYSIVVGAHTHVPMNRRTPNHWVLNSGSVGSPFNHDPAAQYLLLTWARQSWQAEIRRAEYDRDELLRQWHTSGYWDTGVAAQVFAYEIETASFHFWHYLRFCKSYNVTPDDPESFTQYRKDFATNYVF